LERATVGESCGDATNRGDHNEGGADAVNIKLDKTQYQTNLKVLAEEMASVNLERHAFHGEWHYAIRSSHQSMKK